MTATKDLAKIKQAQEDLMPEVVYIQRLVRAEDGLGGWMESWQTVATTRGRIAPSQKQAGEIFQGGAMTVYGEYVVALPADTELQQDDRLQVNGTQYEVRAILDRSEKTVLRVLVNKV